MAQLLTEYAEARQARKLSQSELADLAGLSRMAVQKMEAGTTDPRLSSLIVLARAMGMELMLVPRALRQDLEAFVRSGGRALGQPVGVDAPTSVVDDLLSNSGGR
ncbi:MAG TPA: helix-turn-helix transcriptional regulator [Eoetvoesiella sp.]|jgi:transcriptional regulator with XRE-family HTH domain|uniref:helix-turn-helix transcriptional regulator n=1 Tax=Eoetvoesiella sp. TaxID=1966355 RepID=UPI002C946213|nr:helix-turn-helix transcriptional regulator [Eoetvoesiella sp.]HWK63165.1 helix-turn-helix transcriptional regulator [Eoetvoesiella sp.]